MSNSQRQNIIGSLDVNLSFVTDLLQADIRLFSKNEDGPPVLHNYYRCNQGSLYMDARGMDAAIGKILPTHKDLFVHKAFEMGQRIVGQYGLVINNRPVQEFAYPIVSRKTSPDPSKQECKLDEKPEVVAVIAIERDIYLTRSSLGKYWELIADNVIRGLQKRVDDKKLQVQFPKKALGEGLMILDHNNRVIYISAFALHLIAEISGPNETMYLSKDYEEIFHGFCRHNRGAEYYYNLTKVEEIVLQRRTLITRHTPLSDDMTAILIKDISELKIKDALMKEIHHRVKNNLAAVSGLLRMQSRRNPELKKAFDEAISRTNSISMVHETLAYADDIVNVDFGALARNMLREITSSYGSQHIKINFHCPEQILLPSEKATNMALVLNELVSNSFEHAGEKLSQINISLYRDFDRPGKLPNSHDVILLLEDDGVGFPEGFDYRSRPGLGWEIITTVAQESLSSEMEVANYKNSAGEIGGARVHLCVPDIQV